VQVGLALSVSKDFAKQREGIQLLEKAISPEEVDSPFGHDTIQGRVLVSTAGCWHMQMDNIILYKKILKLFQLKVLMIYAWLPCLLQYCS
jgi:hypothetical protein